MKKNKIAFVGLLVATATASNIHGRISQHKKQEKIMNHLAREILILFRAYTRVQQRVADGKLRETDLNRLQEHIEFEIIALHNE